MLLERVELLKKVDVSGNLAAPQIMGWDGTKYIVAVGTKQDTFNGDDSTTEFTLTYGDIVHGSVVIEVDETELTEDTDYTVDYSAGKITFQTAPASGTDNIVVDYSYFAADPSGILLDDITASQDPDYARLILLGVYYLDNFETAPLVDVIERLARNNIFLVPRTSA